MAKEPFGRHATMVQDNSCNCYVCDNQATIYKAHNMTYNGKSKHICLKHNFVKQLIRDGVMAQNYVQSNENLVDSFTKGFAREILARS